MSSSPVSLQRSSDGLLGEGGGEQTGQRRRGTDTDHVCMCYVYNCVNFYAEAWPLDGLDVQLWRNKQTL